MTGNEFKKIRTSADLTQAEIASILNVTVTTVSQWERGRAKIHPLMADGIRAKTKHLTPQEAA